MNSLEKDLSRKILEELDGDIENATPTLQLQVLHRGRKKVDLKMGREFLYYDLASLTKILFTTTAFIQAVDQGRIKLKSSVSDWNPSWPYPEMKVRQLLQHHAGLPSWNGYYKKLRKVQKRAGESGSLMEIRRESLWKMLCRESPEKNITQAIYSDLDFLVLGYVLEEVYEKSLFDLSETISENLKLENLHFCKNNKPFKKRSLYAPTEKCPWRKRLLQGEVHDDNAWTLLGVSSHAGLFGTIDDVVRWGKWLRKSYRGESSKLGSTAVVRSFSRRSLSREIGDWGLGFMKPSREGSSAGSYFSPSSIGHTGFTGTSFWWDPSEDILVVLLSNRVSPRRDNRRFVSLRPKIHDWVFQALSRS
ncbi:serine hydrolase [Bdellovibrionales bacterium]|nr:serine hydrolase [Bdellovibrionales bacterium]